MCVSIQRLTRSNSRPQSRKNATSSPQASPLWYATQLHITCRAPTGRQVSIKPARSRWQLGLDYADFFVLTFPATTTDPAHTQPTAVASTDTTISTTNLLSSVAYAARVMFSNSDWNPATPTSMARFIWAGLLRFRLLVIAKDEHGNQEHRDDIVAGWRIGSKGEDWIRLFTNGPLAKGELIVVVGSTSRWLPAGGEKTQPGQACRMEKEAQPTGLEERNTTVTVGLATLLCYGDGWVRWWMRFWWS